MKKGLVITGIVAGTLAVGYGAGCYYFHHHFLPNTTLNGTDVSYQDAQSVQTKLTALEDTKLTIQEREEQVETIALDQIGYDVSLPMERLDDVIASQNMFSWPASLFQGQEAEVLVDYSYNKTKLEEAVNALKALDSETMIAPQDAYVGLVDGAYCVVEEAMGTTLDTEKTKEAITKNLSEANLTLNLEEAEVYVDPTVKADDEAVLAKRELLRKVNDEVITIDVIGDSTTMDATTLIGLLQEDESRNVGVNEEALDAYVDWLANTYETYQTSREFTTHTGDVIAVGGGSQDTYGFLLNYESSKNAIREAVNAHTTQTISVYWDLVGHTRNSANGDIGSTYIEIDITQQQLYYFVDGALSYQTAVITGLPQHNQSTPLGVFRIWSKQRNAQLKGTAWDGKKWDSTVAYWMPIDWTGVGLHDADWQAWDAWSSYSWYSVGSHGCVNLPPSSAEYLFYNTINECPVVIHN